MRVTSCSPPWSIIIWNTISYRHLRTLKGTWAISKLRAWNAENNGVHPSLSQIFTLASLVNSHRTNCLFFCFPSIKNNQAAFDLKILDCTLQQSLLACTVNVVSRINPIFNRIKRWNVLFYIRIKWNKIKCGTAVIAFNSFDKLWSCSAGKWAIQWIIELAGSGTCFTENPWASILIAGANNLHNINKYSQYYNMYTFGRNSSFLEQSKQLIAVKSGHSISWKQSISLLLLSQAEHSPAPSFVHYLQQVK